MSDFEERLARGLEDGAMAAPAADGLAGRARARAKVRRRRNAVAAAAAVLAIAMPVGAVATWDREPTRGEEPDSVTGVGDPGPGWHTVLVEREAEGSDEAQGLVLVDVPDGWARIDTSGCEFAWVRFGPADTDPCDGDGSGVWVVGSSTFDPQFGPGLRRESDGEWGGHVGAGQFAVNAQGGRLEVIRRVLASARLVDDPAPDLSGTWRLVEEPIAPGQRVGGLRYAVPRGGGLRVRYLGRAGRIDGGAAYGRQLSDGRWLATMTYPSERQVRVVAPTQALAELVAGSATEYLG